MTVSYRDRGPVGAGVGRLRQRLLDSSAAHPYLVLELTAVDRIDSTGLGVLVGALKWLRVGDGQLRLAAARGDVARALHTTGLDEVLPLYPDPDQGVLRSQDYAIVAARPNP